MWLLLSFVACLSPDCGVVQERSTAACPVDACAAACTDEDAGIACCIDKHGFGLTGTASEDLATACPDCDGMNYLSEAAATCIAQVYGLQPGLECQADFRVGPPPTWRVQTLLVDCGAESAYAEGYYVAFDAVTGAHRFEGDFGGECRR